MLPIDLCRAEKLVRIDHEFLRHACIELAVAAWGVVEADDFHAHDIGDVDTVPHDGLHQLTVVLHDRRLAGMEAVGFRPAQAEADAQAAHFCSGVDGARIFSDIQAGNTDLACNAHDAHQRVEHRGRRFSLGTCVTVATRFEAHGVNRAIDFRLAEQCGDLLMQRRVFGQVGDLEALSFGVRHIEDHETLSAELMCTNQNLPRKLKLGDICMGCEATPEFLSFRNITPVTPSFAPPLNRDFLWKLVSNMSLNYLSLADITALKVILETYDLPRYYDQHAERVSKRLLGGLVSISHETVDRLHRGLPVRGLRTELTIDPEGYIGEGDMFVFASVLNEFFALYASLNSYHELHVKSTQGEVYQWTPRMGLQPLL